MNVKIKVISVALVLLCLLPISLYAQGKSELNQKYLRVKEQMQKAYDNGDVLGVVNTFHEQCCKVKGDDKYTETSEFQSTNDNIKADIYLLLIRSKIALEDTDGNEAYMKKLFAIKHDQTFEDEWLLIRSGKGKFLISHKLRIGIKTGTNLTYGVPHKDFFMLQPTEGGTSGGQKDYKPAIGYSLGVAIEYFITKNFSFELQTHLDQSKFSYTKNHTWGDEFYIGINNEHTNNLKYLEIPLLVRWSLAGKFKPHLEFGVVPAFLLNAHQNLKYRITESTGLVQSNTYYKTMEINEQLSNRNLSLQAGAGFSFDVGSNAFKLNVHYKYGLPIITDPEGRFQNKELMYRFFEVLDDISINQVGVTLSYLYTLSYKAFKK